MNTYMYIQVAFPIIMKQNWRGGAEAGGGCVGSPLLSWSFCPCLYMMSFAVYMNVLNWGVFNLHISIICLFLLNITLVTMNRHMQKNNMIFNQESIDTTVLGPELYCICKFK